MSDNNGNQTEIDNDLYDLAELCGSMIQFYKNLMKNTSVGMYYSFLHDSTEGTDCCYAKKSKKLFYTKHKPDIVRGLKEKRDELSIMIERLEGNNDPKH